MHPVCKFDDQYTDIPAHRHDHFTDSLSLRTVTDIHFRQFRYPINKARNSIAKFSTAFIEGVLGIFNSVMEKPRCYDFRAHAQVCKYLRNCYGMDDIGFAGAPLLMRMLDNSALICFPEYRQVTVRIMVTD